MEKTEYTKIIRDSLDKLCGQKDDYYRMRKYDQRIVKDLLDRRIRGELYLSSENQVDDEVNKMFAMDYPYWIFEDPSIAQPEDKVLIAIERMLELGYDPNIHAPEESTFVEDYIFHGWNFKFIWKLLTSISKHQLEEKRFDVNHQDDFGSTILHILFSHATDENDLRYIQKILDIPTFHFDSTLKDSNGDTPVDLFKTFLAGTSTSHITINEELIKNVSKKLSPNYIKNSKSKSTSDFNKQQLSFGEDAEVLKHYGIILNNKAYSVEPIIGREKELESVFIALAKDRKNPLIIGESGVGKTCIIDELAYLLQQDRVPNFLKGQIIFELDRNALIGKTEYVGSLERETKKCLDICVKYGILVFIDEMQSFKGAGSYKDSATDVLDIIQRYIDRLGLKVISTTTKADYLETFANSPLKRRFDPITIEEPGNEVMRMILKNYFENKQEKSQIQLDENLNIEDIIDILIEYTENAYRVYDDKQNNPDLALSIVESAYAKCLVRNSLVLRIEDFIYAFQACDRLYKHAKEFAVINLSNLATYDQIDRPQNNIIQFRPINPNK